jgi:hypothetical protein
MNRISRINVLSAVACLAHLSGAARADDPPGKGPAELHGCWKLVSVESDGKASDPVGGGQPRSSTSSSATWTACTRASTRSRRTP